MNLKSVFLLIFVMIFTGCSIYTFNPKGKSTIGSISIELFENTTSEYGLEDRMTELVSEAFINDGSIKVVPTVSAEAQLHGKLIKYIRAPYEYDENDVVTSYGITMTFEIKLINSLDNVEIWTNQISHIGIYNIEEELEEIGQLRAIGKLVDDIINKTTKSW